MAHRLSGGRRADPSGAAARTLIRASGPERGAMRLTGHTSRTIFDRHPIIHEQELLKAEDELVAVSGAAGAGAPRARAPDRRRRHAASPHPRGVFIQQRLYASGVVIQVNSFDLIQECSPEHPKTV